MMSPHKATHLEHVGREHHTPSVLRACPRLMSAARCAAVVHADHAFPRTNSCYADRYLVLPRYCTRPSSSQKLVGWTRPCTQGGWAARNCSPCIVAFEI